MAPNLDSSRKKTYNLKSSDRRKASGVRAEAFLHSTQKNKTGKLAPARKPADKDVWDPKHFRLFVGNLGDDATDDILAAAFSKYASVSKVRVPIDAKTRTNRGYGFVAFASADDYLKAFKEMNGKYVGLRPVQLKRAESKAK